MTSKKLAQKFYRKVKENKSGESGEGILIEERGMCRSWNEEAVGISAEIMVKVKESYF